MTKGYSTFSLIWNEHAIEVSYEANWLSTENWHIELRCENPLPVTQSGYRSQFVPAAELSDEEDIRAYVLSWLEEAAENKQWQRFLEDSRQLKLF